MRTKWSRMVFYRCHITLKTDRFGFLFLLGHCMVDVITVILLENFSVPPPHPSFQALYIGNVLREAARCVLGKKVSSFRLTRHLFLQGNIFLIWNLSETHSNFILSELFFFKGAYRSKTGPNKSEWDTPGYRGCTVVYGSSNHHTYFQKLPWARILLSWAWKSKRVMALGQRVTRVGGNPHLQLLGYS